MKKIREFDVLIQRLYRDGESSRSISKILKRDGQNISRTTIIRVVRDLGFDTNQNNHKVKGRDCEEFMLETFNRWNTPTKTFETIDEMIQHFKMNNIYLSGVCGGKRQYVGRVKIDG